MSYEYNIRGFPNHQLIWTNKALLLTCVGLMLVTVKIQQARLAKIREIPLNFMNKRLSDIEQMKIRIEEGMGELLTLKCAVTTLPTATKALWADVGFYFSWLFFEIAYLYRPHIHTS